eukprot:TRINITY_DN19637_c0_g1_i4.p1 TRINITY_DN19637_c0_g1~~TRINITY_DN19637_c0_g1_i4.p1  ORF type:complete len:193 (-),score=30.67 TRINITY_DN19637_c0_g1_i4:499-1077(-)
MRIVRCGTIRCWQIGTIAALVCGLVSLTIALCVYFSGDPSLWDCADNQNYFCDSGCFSGGNDLDCDTLPNTDSDACPNSDDSGTYNAQKACKCENKNQCDHSQGVVAAALIGILLLALAGAFSCGAVPCCCFARKPNRAEMVYDGNAPPGHPAEVVSHPCQMVATGTPVQAARPCEPEVLPSMGDSGAVKQV